MKGDAMEERILEILQHSVEFKGTSGWTSPIKAERVLIIAPHPDDEVIGCGGVILNYLEQGSDVTVVIVTNGEFGCFGEKTVDRNAECVSAWNRYDTLDIRFFGQKDSQIVDSVMQQYREILVEKNPDVIYVPWILDRHMDHVLVNYYLKRVFDDLRMDGYVLAFYEVLYPLYANKIVNISKFLDKKEVLLKYQSQIQYLNLEEIITYQSQLRAAQIRLKRVRYAEAFCVCDVASYKALVESVSVYKQ